MSKSKHNAWQNRKRRTHDVVNESPLTPLPHYVKLGVNPDRQADRQAGRQAGRQARQAGRQADRQTGRQTGRQTDRQAGRQA